DEENLKIEPPQLVQGGYDDEQPIVVDKKDLDFEPQQFTQDLDSSPVEAKHGEDDNKFQPDEHFSAIVDTVSAVVAEQKEPVTAIGKDRDQRVYFDFNFVITDLEYDSNLKFRTFAPIPVVPLSMTTAINIISTAPPLHLVPSFDPGRNCGKQESSFNNPFPSKPSKPQIVDFPP
ncbi:hypothetical protein A2U01_0015819, partial [Trifolium medium]|nr:hypothetical protein [Trifolium medium]